MKRADDRMLWVLRWADSPLRRGHLVVFDRGVTDAFLDAFPEAERTAKHYMQGPSVVPMLGRACRRARDRGLFKAWSLGNQDARSNGQPTWSRVWELTILGRAALAEADRGLVKRTATVRANLSHGRPG